jgi:HD-like signal output (HDOD) protein/CheY-like chemotaxis protein
VTGRPHILFVDDEPRLLGGLRRMLRGHRDRWDMSFAEGGEAALAVLRSQACDLIVSDYRMPGMDGAELLERVRTEYPGTARMILSGQTDEDNLFALMALADEFLAKPSTPEELVATLERLISVRPPAATGGTRRPAAIVGALPSPPRVLADLVAALDAGDATAASVAAVIEGDPAATAKVLHLVNSSAYTAGHRISDVAEAVSLLGLHTVRGLALGHGLIHPFEPGGAVPAGWIEALTRHAVETARLSRLLAAGTGGASEAFAAGLLHEVGQLVLASSRPAAFAVALAAWRDAGAHATLAAAELAALGVSHVEAGTDLLGRWGLPAPVVEAVAGHGGAVPPAVTGPASAVALAHAVVEAALGPVCGPAGGTGAPGEDAPDGAALDEAALDEAAREAVTRWRRHLC